MKGNLRTHFTGPPTICITRNPVDNPVIFAKNVSAKCKYTGLFPVRATFWQHPSNVQSIYSGCSMDVAKKSSSVFTLDVRWMLPKRRFNWK